MNDMKISITLEFDINPDTWATEYGLDLDEAKADARAFLPELVAGYVGEMPHVKSGIIDLVKKD
jgi:hypothetical protein